MTWPFIHSTHTSWMLVISQASCLVARTGRRKVHGPASRELWGKCKEMQKQIFTVFVLGQTEAMPQRPGARVMSQTLKRHGKKTEGVSQRGRH